MYYITANKMGPEKEQSPPEALKLQRQKKKFHL